MSNPELCDIPETWSQLEPAKLHGTVLIIGASDTGKSTLARYLLSYLSEQGRRVGLLDCDVGQSILGLPTTLNLLVAEPGALNFPPPGRRAAFFVGHVTPRGHMLPVLVGAHKLQQQANAWGAEVLLVDTTGLIAPAQGGVALKRWKIELLNPTTVIALARERELDRIIWPLRRDRRLRLIELPVSPHAHLRPREVRIERRRQLFQAYFAQASIEDIPLDHRPIYGLDEFVPGRLLALQDEAGFCLGLAIGRRYDSRHNQITALTPVTDFTPICSLRVGSLWLDPVTGREREPVSSTAHYSAS